VLSASPSVVVKSEALYLRIVEEPACRRVGLGASELSDFVAYGKIHSNTAVSTPYQRDTESQLPPGHDNNSKFLSLENSSHY
jgi:hypothetical protein